MTQEALKLALEKIATVNAMDYEYQAWAREALAQEQEPVAWQGLTDDEMESTFLECGGKWNGDFWKIEDADFHPFLRTIEAKLKDKNF